MDNYDVVIVGAGMVGLTLALALKNSGLNIVVIDKGSAPQSLGPEPELQVSALTLASINIIKNIEGWDGLDHSRVTPYTDMQVWDQDSFAQIDFSHKQGGHACLGYLLENQNLRLSLWRRAEQAANIRLLSEQAIKTLGFGQTECFITLENGSNLSTRLVVGADGPESMVKRQANFAQTFWDYDQHGIVATIKTDLPHQGVAQQVFTPYGPLAFLPLWQDNLCSIVWSQDTDKSDALMGLSKEQFEKSLTVAFDGRLGRCELVSPVKRYPLKMRYARQWLDERVVLVGDAAHTIHPLAGQGANLGLVDAAALAEQIISCHTKGKDFGMVRHLRPYERWRKTEAVKMIALMQGFKELFAGNMLPKKFIRGAGLAAINRLGMTKQAMVKQMMGVDGELPKLAKLSKDKTLP
jgi:2-octaprenylphenol hydroxylase